METALKQLMRTLMPNTVTTTTAFLMDHTWTDLKDILWTPGKLIRTLSGRENAAHMTIWLADGFRDVAAQMRQAITNDSKQPHQRPRLLHRLALQGQQALLLAVVAVVVVVVGVPS